MNNVMEDAIKLGETLQAATAKAVTMLEKLAEAQEIMMTASSGILPDGTPVQDMLDDLKDTKAREASLRNLIRSIKYEANNCKSTTAYASIKIIRTLVDASKAI